MKKTTPRRGSVDVVQSVTLTQLCRSCGVHANWVIELVDHGVLEPLGRDHSEWVFPQASLARVMKADRLNRDLGLNFPGIAMVLDLLEERARLISKVGSTDDPRFDFEVEVPRLERPQR